MGRCPDDFSNASAVFCAVSDLKNQFPMRPHRSCKVRKARDRLALLFKGVTAFGLDADACLVQQIKPAVLELKLPAPFVLSSRSQLAQKQGISGHQFSDQLQRHFDQCRTSCTPCSRGPSPRRSSATRDRRPARSARPAPAVRRFRISRGGITERIRSASSLRFPSRK